MEPKRLGPYQIVGTLGHGGMGAVYEALNVETDERAAIKVLSASLSEHGDFKQRFEAEIETLRKLHHPNIVQLFGFGEQEGVLFYAMELVQGKSLEQELRGGRVFAWRKVTQIGIDTCGALRHAHDRGVIHRDIKPANLLLTPDGQIKLSDFGIARLFGNTRLTMVGNVLGTVEFMAPEQADGGAIGPRTDLYSLGGVMYALLTGRPPFRARTPIQMIEKQRFAQPEPVSRYAPTVPDELESIILQLLQKEPEKRIANAWLLMRRLEAMLHGLSQMSDSQNADSRGTVNAAYDLPAAADDQSEELPMPLTQPIDEGTDHPVSSGSPPVDAAPVGDSASLDEGMPETRVTSAFKAFAEADSRSPMPPHPPVPAQPDEHEESGTRFTTVREEELDQDDSQGPSRTTIISPHTWVLVIGLVLVGSLVWYLLRPPLADTLYGRVKNLTAEKTISSYRQAESDIRKFLLVYSDDSRCGELRDYLEEIELDRLESRSQAMAMQGLADRGNLLPIQRDYVEAIKYLRLDPDLGTAKLQALCDLYDPRLDRSQPLDTSGPTGRYVELSLRRLKRLRKQTEDFSSDHLAWILARLERADELSESAPDRARSIRAAVIVLYSGKPWATEAVCQAQDALASQSGSPDEN